MINMPLLSCDKILPISLPAYLQLQSPYYFPKVVWSLSLDYSIPSSTSYAPRVRSSLKCVMSPGMEYGNVLQLMYRDNHFIDFPVWRRVQMLWVSLCFLTWSFVA